MMANHHHHRLIRVDTLQIKDAMYQKIGPQKAHNYFIHLERFLHLKMSKIEFNKSCIQIIGRENISLHNCLIQSILHNAKIPPNEDRKAEVLNVKVANCSNRSHLQSLCVDTLDQAPRKCRSRRDRKFKERKSPVGPLGKSPSITYESILQEQQSGAGRPLMVEDGEEVEQSGGRRWWASVTAPVDVSFNIGGDRRGLHFTSLNNYCFSDTCQGGGELPDTNSLVLRMQKKLEEGGVGISRDGANLLNKSLDVYLKKIILQCVGIAGDPFNGKRMSGLNGISPKQQTYVNLLDFRVAMESNPFVLGEDWPLYLEKICNYSFQ